MIKSIKGDEMQPTIGRPKSENPRNKAKQIRLNDNEISLLEMVLSASGGINYSKWIREHLESDAEKLGIDIQDKLNRRLEKVNE